MKANTAISLFLLGISIVLLNREPVSARRLYAGRAAVGAVWILVSLSLLEYALGINLGIDKLFPYGWVPGTGRMSSVTAIALELLSSAVLLQNATWHEARRLAQPLAITGGSIGLVDLVGYLYSAVSLSETRSFTGMALNTAFAITVAACGIVCARPQSGLTRTVLSSSPGGLMTRRLLPIGLVAPLAVGWLELSGQFAGYYGTEAGTGLLVIVVLMIFMGAIVLTARGVDRIDYARALAERETRRIAEKARSEREFGKLIDAAPDSLLVLNRAGEIVLVNMHAEKQFGYRREELIGQKIATIIPTGFAELLLEEWERFSVTTQERKIDTPIELSGRRKDGTGFPIETMISPLETGEETLMITAMRDITERRNAEQVIREGEERFQNMANNISQLAWMADGNGSIFWYNQRWFDYTGMALAEMAGWGWQSVQHPDHVDRVVNEILRCLQLSEVWEDTFPLRGHDGNYRWFLSRALPILDGEGRVFRWFGTNTDVTEIRKAEESLHQQAIDLRLEVLERIRAEEEMHVAKNAADVANQAKSEFLANMSHELRTPLNGVLGMTAVALDTELTAEQRDVLETIKLSGDALLVIINDILDFSKIEAGMTEVEAIDFNLRNCAEEALRMVAPLADERGLELTCDFAPTVPEHVQGDPGRLRQIMLNLVNNAIKFTHHGEVGLKVEVESEDGDTRVIRFTVTDTGIGIPAEKQSAVFFPFTQADSSTTRKYGGTGLGLTISKRLVTMMGGNIWLESEPGAGTQFHFNVRLRLSATLPHAELPIAPVHLAGLRILVVDDNPTNLRILEGMLAHWGAETTCAGSGQHALELLDSAGDSKPAYQLVLTDMQMPGMGGFELAKHIRQRSYVSPAILIMLTSGGQREDVERCHELGIRSYLYKPIRKRELLEAIVAIGRPQSAPLLLQATEAERSTQPGSLLILLAEDNRVNQTVATRLLKKMGYPVIVAGNGQQALSLLATYPIDLVLMDIQMPEMDGLAATMSIRQDEKLTGRHLPIIAMTAHAMSGDRDRCIAAGMDGYITKPINSKHLEEAMAGVLRGTGHILPVATA